MGPSLTVAASPCVIAAAALLADAPDLAVLDRILDPRHWVN